MVAGAIVFSKATAVVRCHDISQVLAMTSRAATRKAWAGLPLPFPLPKANTTSALLYVLSAIIVCPSAPYRSTLRSLHTFLRQKALSIDQSLSQAADTIPQRTPTTFSTASRPRCRCKGTPGSLAKRQDLRYSPTRNINS